MDSETKTFFTFLFVSIIVCILLLFAASCTVAPEQRCRDAGLSVHKIIIEENQGTQNSRVECLKLKGVE